MDTSGDARPTRARRRRLGTGPPAAVVIAWAILSDPALRSAVECAATRAESARQRGRILRRRITLALLSAVSLALAIRGLLWLAL